MRLQINMDTGDQAMTFNPKEELQSLMRQIMEPMANAIRSNIEDRGSIHDSNGNTIGIWRTMK